MPSWLLPIWGGIVGALISAAVGAIKHFRSCKSAQKGRMAVLESGVTALLHDSIYKEYAECVAKGFATVDDVRNIEYLYTPYHALGGNGTGTELYNRIKEMPDKPAGKESK